MLFSIQTPIRGSQEVYRRFIDSLEAQTFKDFELIVCNDCSDYYQLQPIKTSFPHRLAILPKRPPGWGYPCARNICLDYCTLEAEYLVHLDADWILRPKSLENVLPMLDVKVIIEGYKQYTTVGPKEGKFVRYPEFEIIPLQSVLQCRGWDEIFFPHYAGYWHDLMRRLQLVSKLLILESKDFVADDIGGTGVIFDRNKNSPGFDIAKELEAYKTIYPVERNLFLSQLIWEEGY